MSAESTESIIDLLYGELSEEEASEVRAELQSSVQRQAEHDELERLLGRVREAMPPQDVAPSVHASIMDAARAGVASQERAPRRVAEPARPQRFWSRLAGQGRGQGQQLALVATVLVAGAFIVYLTNPSSSPLSSPAADISSMQEAAAPPPALASPVVVAEAEQSAPAPEPADEPMPAPQQVVAEGVRTDEREVARDRSAGRAAPAPTAEEQARIDASLRNELARTVDRTREQATPPPAKRARKSAAKAKRVEASNAGLPRAGATTKSASVDMLGDDAMPAAPVAAEPMGDALAEAEVAAPVESKKERADAPAEESAVKETASLSAVHEHYGRSDYPGTIRAANNFLSDNPDAPANDRAAAMHIKAQALTQSGRYDEADQVYRQIQANYPGYQSGAIRDAREDVNRLNTQRKPAAPKMRQLESDYEFTE